MSSRPVFPNSATFRSFRVLRGACATAALLLLAGCSIPIPKAEPDPTRFYILSATTTAKAAEQPPERPSVKLREIELPSYLRAQPVVVRRGNNEIEFRELARWGEPLETGIARVLREELLALGAAASVTMPGYRSARSANDYEVAVRVLAFEGGMEGDVRFRAVWEVFSGGEKPASVKRGEFAAANLQWDSNDEASLVEQLSNAVARLAADIAAALPK